MHASAPPQGVHVIAYIMVRLSVLLTLLMAVAAGCTLPLHPTSEQLARGYVLVLPGVEGNELSVADIIAGLHDGGVDQAIDVGLWGTHPFGTLANLYNYDQNRKRSAELADRLVEYHRNYPDGPMTIVGCSGGCGIAAFTAEALPADIKLERIILLAAALSPRYDLKPSLAHTRHGIVSFYNPRDEFILGWGTQTFGTMDRKFTIAAGKVGFKDSQGRLVGGGIKQVPWTREWRSFGHFGGHAGWSSAEWARHVLAPYMVETVPAITQLGSVARLR